MAGVSDSQTRLGLTLQGYDQVIALSQANINESLEYHFTANPQLCNFNVVFADKGYGLKGTLKPSTIELIDVENADRAVFKLNFETGKYFWTEFPKADPNAPQQLDEDGLPVLPQPKRQSLLVANWAFAFLVDFSVKRMSSIPEDIKKKIELPGVYSVDQLMIDFGTADILNFSWKDCVTPSIPADKQAGGRADIERFVSQYIQTVLLAPGDHNILGYAVKIDKPKDGQSEQDLLKTVTKDAPSFPPTSLRLQTINHRPDGDEARATTTNDHNAFLFTEMTQFRKMPNDDLRWSGDWFYESIGGTMAMSNGIFVKQFLAKKLRFIAIDNYEMANQISRAYALQGGDWVLAGSRLTVDQVEMAAEGSGLKMSWTNTNKTVQSKVQKTPWPAPDIGVEWKNTVEIYTSIEPQVGTGKTKIESKVLVLGNQNIQAGELATVGFNIYCLATWSATLDLRAVEDGGSLLVEADVSKPEVVCNVKNYTGHVLDKIPILNSLLDSLVKSEKDRLDASTASMQTGIEDFVNKMIGLDSIKNNIQNALNGQGRFIFPGGGTFEMKDPIFSKAGDLLIGLTYKKGDAGN